MLQNVFGEANVEHSIIVNGWSIDMHVVSIDTYVQFDGVYWHGLDRSLDLIERSGKAIDAVILEKWRRDREQDAWFECRKMKLVRVTDVEWDNADDRRRFLLERLGLA